MQTNLNEIMTLELKQKLGAILKVSMTWMSSFDFYVSFIKVIESWVMG